IPRSGIFWCRGRILTDHADTVIERDRKRSTICRLSSETPDHDVPGAVRIPSPAVPVSQLHNVYWSDEMYRIFCLDPGPTAPSSMEAARRLHPEDIPQHHATVQQAILDKSDFESDYRLLLPNGTTKYIHVVGHPVVNPSGDVIEIV